MFFPQIKLTVEKKSFENKQRDSLCKITDSKFIAAPRLSILKYVKGKKKFAKN